MNPTNRRRVAITAALAAFGLGSFVATQDASAQRRPRADSDYDNDGINNRRDRDDDNDGRIDRRDRDDDNDGINDKRDRDDDNDGVRDQADNDPYMGHGPRPGTATHTWRFSYRPMRYDDRHYDDIDAYDLGYGFDGDEFYTHLGSDYRRFDRNRDGRLQLGERQAFWIHMARMGMFGPMSPAQAREMGSLAAIMDTNGNGQLTRYELRRLTRFIKARQLFIAFDRNRDGRVYRRETRGYFAREFNALDLNGDRTLTMMELRRSLMAGPRRTYWGYR